MADQSMSVSGPVTVKADSIQRVALDLADKINNDTDGNTPRDRAYWFNLYGQCLQVVLGRDVKKVISGQ